MNWNGTITLRVSATLPCEKSDCYAYKHYFEVTATATTPLLLDEEKRIRERLQGQLDTLLTHFLEVHK